MAERRQEQVVHYLCKLVLMIDYVITLQCTYCSFQALSSSGVLRCFKIKSISFRLYETAIYFLVFLCCFPLLFKVCFSGLLFPDYTGNKLRVRFSSFFVSNMIE